MKKLIVLAAGLALLVPSLAFADSFSLRTGYFWPRAVSSSYLAQHPNSLWSIELTQMTFNPENFNGWLWGASYERFLGPKFSLQLSFDTYYQREFGDYWDYDQTEFDEGWFAFPVDMEPSDITDWYYISHEFKVTSTPVMLSLKLSPFGRKSRIIPFVGGGVGVYFWSAGIFGEMVDFSDDTWYYPDPVYGDIQVYPVIPVSAHETEASIGYHAFGGIQIPIGFRSTIDVEARYHWAVGHFDDPSFVDFDGFDLGGISVLVGFTFWF